MQGGGREAQVTNLVALLLDLEVLEDDKVARDGLQRPAAGVAEASGWQLHLVLDLGGVFLAGQQEGWQPHHEVPLLRLVVRVVISPPESVDKVLLLLLQGALQLYLLLPQLAQPPTQVVGEALAWMLMEACQSALFSFCSDFTLSL